MALRPLFPDHGARLVEAADAFDAVRYGHVPAVERTARAVVAVDAELLRTRPQPVGVTA